MSSFDQPFVNCGVCHKYFKSNGIKFYLTSCAHILCQEHVKTNQQQQQHDSFKENSFNAQRIHDSTMKKDSTSVSGITTNTSYAEQQFQVDQCGVCKKGPVYALELNENRLPAELKNYFIPITKQIEVLFTASNFQNMGLVNQIKFQNDLILQLLKKIDVQKKLLENARSELHDYQALKIKHEDLLNELRKSGQNQNHFGLKNDNNNSNNNQNNKSGNQIIQKPKKDDSTDFNFKKNFIENIQKNLNNGNHGNNGKGNKNQQDSYKFKNKSFDAESTAISPMITVISSSSPSPSSPSSSTTSLSSGTTYLPQISKSSSTSRVAPVNTGDNTSRLSGFAFQNIDKRQSQTSSSASPRSSGFTNLRTPSKSRFSPASSRISINQQHEHGLRPGTILGHSSMVKSRNYDANQRLIYSNNSNNINNNSNNLAFSNPANPQIKSRTTTSYNTSCNNNKHRTPTLDFYSNNKSQRTSHGISGIGGIGMGNKTNSANSRGRTTMPFSFKPPTSTMISKMKISSAKSPYTKPSVIKDPSNLKIKDKLIKDLNELNQENQNSARDKDRITRTSGLKSPFF
ncbi:hypothetical protein B5S33_g1873 [[Candida] boidinii]|nr:hypothetical protein B5S33_g1873 [[Candida] boidinii]